MQQDVTVIEDMLTMGDVEGVKTILDIIEKEIKKGNSYNLYRKPVNGKQEVVAVLKNEADLIAYRKRVLGEGK